MALALTWNSRADLNLKFSEFFNSNHTISVWFMPQFPDSYIGPIVAEGSAPVAPGQPPQRPQPAFFLMGTGEYNTETPDMPRLAVRVGGTERHYNQPFTANAWHHLALVRDGNTFKLFLDGTALSSTIVDNKVPVAKDTPVRIGQTAKWRGVFGKRPTQFYGLIDDLAVFTKALTASEIANLAKPSTKLTGGESALLAGFPMSKSSAGAPSKLARKVTLHGDAALVDTSPTRSNTADAKLLPMPPEAFRFTLPVSLHQPLFVGQGPRATGGTHKGGRNFPYDLTPADLSKSGDIDKFENHKPIPDTPFLALSAGTVDLVVDGIPPGTQDPPNTNTLFISIDGMPGYWWKHLHWKSGTANVSEGDTVTPGQILANIGASGETNLNNIHLHTAIVYFPDGEVPPDVNPTHTVSVPYAFVDYFALTRKEDATGTHDTWNHVDVGIPERQAIANSPPFVRKKDDLKMPKNQDHLLDRKRELEIQKRLARPRKFVTLKD